MTNRDLYANYKMAGIVTREKNLEMVVTTRLTYVLNAPRQADRCHNISNEANLFSAEQEITS